MLPRRTPLLSLALVALVALGYALTLRVPESKNKGSFWSDESTYHSMAYSLAFDGDLRYDPEDLERVYELGYTGGPSGLFLVRNPDSGELFFAKAYAYSLFAAPFVRGFGDNGFFVLHALLLGAMLAAGYAYLARAISPGRSAIYTVTYVLGSAVTLYWFWLTPEWFNFSLVFLATFLWLYKEEIPGAPRGTRGERIEWLCGGWTDYAAAAVYAIATYSKPPNALLLLPLLAWMLFSGRWKRGVAVGLVAASVILAMFAFTWASIGDWNYMGGDRKTFQATTSYPYMGNRTFDNTGIAMVTNIEDYAERIPEPTNLARDLVYVWIGRNGGLLPYMFPAVVALLLFQAAPARSLRGPHALVAAGFLLEVVAIVLVVKGNWIGGGGTVGSRYFVNAYPLLFFLIPAGVGLAGAVASWVVWALFVGQIVTNPFTISQNPSFHTKRAPYTLLPTELTLLHDLPFNTHGQSRRVKFAEPANYLGYFLDDNTYRREADLGGFWVKGGVETEFVLRTREPVESIDFEVVNRTAPNRVILRLGGEVVDRFLEPRERLAVSLPAGPAHFYANSYLYRLTAWSEELTIPLFDTPGSGDTRQLGVFVRPTVPTELAFP